MFATTLSALYGKLLVVMGIAFPMAEVISTYIPPSFYEVSNCITIHSLNDFRPFSSNVEICVDAGFLFIFIHRQHVVFILYVCNDSMGKTKGDQSSE